MVCYTIPLVAVLIHKVSGKKITSWRNNFYHLWLNLLFIGGAMFGIIDHIWNGELLLIKNNILSDILLGCIISIIIYLTWFIIVTIDKSNKNKSKLVQY